MTGERIAGKRGRLPARPPGDRLAIGYLHDYARTALPAPVYPVDVTSGIRSWGMAGNDRYGDCTLAGRFHNQMAKAAAGREPMPSETTSELIAEYFAYTGGQDTGAVIADLLLTWYRSGRILAFAPVDHKNPAACDSAMAAFHGLYAGVELTPDAESRFEAGQPWTVSHGQQPDPDAGHCIVKVRAAGHRRHDTWVTWGALQDSTHAWTHACLAEAWVIVTHEDAAAASLDIAALRADIDALGGTGGTPPAPPAAAVGPLHGLGGLLRDITRLVRQRLNGHAGNRP